MKSFELAAFSLLLMLVGLVGCDRQTPQSPPPELAAENRPTPDSSTTSRPVLDAAATESTSIELEWDALIPAEWRPERLFEEYGADDLTDDDPRAQLLMEKIQTLWKEAPVVHDYDGKTVKLPGFVVPLDLDATEIREFLLVPYYGACIHTPPPPANQTVHVVTDEHGAYAGQLFDTVWVTGKISVERVSSELGDAGYRIEAETVEPYQ